MGEKYVFELFSDMPTNDFKDCMFSGDVFIEYISSRAMKIIDALIQDRVEFTVYLVKECVLDKSYKYWVENDQG